MKHLVYAIDSLVELESILSYPSNIAHYESASSVLIQLYSSQLEASSWEVYLGEIRQRWPKAQIVGGSSSGEITSGRSFSKTLVFSALCFDYSYFRISEGQCDNANEVEQGEQLNKWLSTEILNYKEHHDQFKGLMLLTTPLNFRANEVVMTLRQSLVDVVVFGGGLGHYEEGKVSSTIIHNEKVFDCGFIAIAFFGDQLELKTLQHLGWRAFSQHMTITKCEENKVFEVDGRPAFDLYHKYLKIENDHEFELNTKSFPFLVSRGDHYLARVPVTVEENGALTFYASMQKNDQFKIGYADSHSMISSARDLQDQMANFLPEAILLFSCESRLSLLTNDVDLETYPFDMIAPTAGFYTVGEYCGKIKTLESLNSAFVAVGFKEISPERLKPDMAFMPDEATVEIEALERGTLSSEASLTEYWQWREGFTDEMIRKTVVVRDPQAVSRLVQYISVVTAELEATNQALEQLSIIDKLTQLYNRMKLDEFMAQEIVRAKRYGSSFAVIMIDVDYFKSVNDQHGHLVGDQVLVEVANLLKSLLVRETDVLGRWGGEEFLIILPENELDQALKLAWKLKTAVSDYLFVMGIKMTCSFGATSYQPSDTEDSILNRADQALLRAKELGRNRVECE